MTYLTADPFGNNEQNISLYIHGFNAQQLGYTLDGMPLGDQPAARRRLAAARLRHVGGALSGHLHARRTEPVLPARSNFNKVWAADAAALRVAAAGTPPFIVVGIDQPGAARYRQYFPQALYDAASPALRAKFDRLAKGPITGDAYLAFLTDDLKPLIDRTYRTQPDPAHTAIAGSSMGGLISCYAFLARPDVFGRAACVSTHWPLADPADIGPFSTEVAGLWRQYITVHLGPPAGRRLWLDHGTATLDANYAPWQTAIDADLAALGWVRDRDFTSRTYDRAAHEENAWAARLDDIFSWLWR